MDAFKQLVESGVISEAVKGELESAFNQKIQENRDQVTAELREEFANRYEHDKGVMVEALDKLVSERLAAELGEFVTDRKALAETKAEYKRKIASDSKTMESFVMSQLAKELVEFQNDLSVIITQLGQDLDFDNLSRGERNRLILSMSWAFRDVWENLYHSINLLFIDELVDSGMDSSGVESSIAVLKRMTRERDKNVFLISHRDDLTSRVNHVLKVIKENGFTSYSNDIDIVE